MADSGSTSVQHPIFARVYAQFARTLEAKGAAEHRREALEGRVVEVGAGNGLNFKHYPSTVVEVVAVEPESFLRARAKEAGAKAALPVRVVDGTAENLPLEDGSVDAGVISLVMCPVSDPAGALAELRRVIRPGGELRSYEHVLASSPRWARRQQRWANAWARFGGGCYPNRDSADNEVRHPGHEETFGGGVGHGWTWILKPAGVTRRATRNGQRVGAARTECARHHSLRSAPAGRRRPASIEVSLPQFSQISAGTSLTTSVIPFGSATRASDPAPPRWRGLPRFKDS